MATARGICDEMGRRMAAMGVVTTAHIDCGQALIAEAIYDARIVPETILEATQAEVEQLRAEARKFYHADGSFRYLDTPEEVRLRRVESARELDRLREIEREINAFFDRHVWRSLEVDSSGVRSTRWEVLSGSGDSVHSFEDRDEAVAFARRGIGLTGP